jgi:hypothetical protein
MGLAFVLLTVAVSYLSWGDKPVLDCAENTMLLAPPIIYFVPKNQVNMQWLNGAKQVPAWLASAHDSFVT